jgi:hypothetical protein
MKPEAIIGINTASFENIIYEEFLKIYTNYEFNYNFEKA